MPDTATFKTIIVKPLSPNLGAEIEGVDLSQPLSNAQFDDIHQAFLKHHVIFFRDQKLSIEQHMAFGRRFGMHEPIGLARSPGQRCSVITPRHSWSR